MSDQPVPLSIVIPCRNERDAIEECLRSILRQDRTIPFEVIVADGMSDDGTRDILLQFAENEPRLRIVDNPGRIVSTGLNAGLTIARGDIIMRMDAHTEYAPDYIRACIDVLTKTQADNVGGPWVAKGNGIVAEAIAAAFQSPFAVGGARAHNPRYEGLVDTVYLGCWPRSVFDRIGRFDEDLVRNQDDEFNLRVLAHGGRIWQSPRIRSSYRVRGSLGALFRQYTQYGYWKVRVIQKHGTPASIRHVIPAMFVLALLSASVAALWFPTAAKALAVLTGSYVAAAVVASVVTAAAHRWKLLLILPGVFACYHIGYGYGFLRGIGDFWILRRPPRRGYAALTRERASPRQHHASTS
jgi:succinoglycan biosynthesis protein ExoA